MTWLWITGGIVLAVAVAVCVAVKILSGCLEIDVSDDDEAEEGDELEDNE